MHKQKLAPFVAFFLLVVAAVVLTLAGRNEKPHKLTKQERIDGAIEFTKRHYSDIDLGVVPEDKRFKAIAEGQRRLLAQANNRSSDQSISDAIWRERGPNNRGGRTRAIMIDEKDP